MGGTKKGARLNGLLTDDVRGPYVVEGSPWRQYLRCDECGADAGLCCRDMDDAPAVEVCGSRRLGVVHVESRRVRSDPSSVGHTHSVEKKRKHGIIGQPIIVPCRYCGTSIRLWGASIRIGHGWCSAPECQADRKREKALRSSRCRACGTAISPRRTLCQTHACDPTRAARARR